MKKMNRFFNRARNGFAKAAIAGGASLAPVLAHAQLDAAAVQSALQDASSTGLTVGGYVIAAVAALVVIGVVIGIIKKL